jgi:acetyl-CoA C-acetyltransferase
MDCYIYDAVRTPRGRGKSGGGLNSVAPIDLAAAPLKALLSRQDFDATELEDVVLGCVEPIGEQGGNIARVAALYAGLPQNVPGFQINRFCSSGLESVNICAAKVMAGMAHAAIGGGVESMSRVPMGSSSGPWATNPAVATQLKFVPQGISADLVATKYGYTREQCDSLAVRSQELAAAAWEAGHFANSVVPVVDQNDLTVLDRDEHMRPGTTVESLAKLRAAFKMMGENYGFNAVAKQRYPEIESINHVHHAGNSSGIVDGASAVLVGTEDFGTRNALTPRARIRSFGSIGSEPTIMLTGPSDAAEVALTKAGLTAADIDLWEINEAFSAVVLRFVDALAIDMERVNVNGGAIAMGHPLGATGAMILGTLLDEMERRDLKLGCAALCVGAGMGTATIIERA